MLPWTHKRANASTTDCNPAAKPAFFSQDNFVVTPPADGSAGKRITRRGGVHRRSVAMNVLESWAGRIVARFGQRRTDFVFNPIGRRFIEHDLRHPLPLLYFACDLGIP